MRELTVSVVVPSYQQADFVEASVQSVLREARECDEVIVYDAGSTDGTVDILETYRDQFTRFVVEPDRGQAHAINKGLKQAKGDIQCYLNSDDVLLPGSLQRVAEYFRTHPGVDLLYGKAFYIDRGGTIIGDYRTFDWDENRFLEECFICQPAAFWRMRVRDRIGSFDEKLNCSMDYDYWLRIAKSGMRIDFFDQYLACSRDYPETKTRRDRRAIYRENFCVLLKRLGYVPAHWLGGYLHLLKYHNKLGLSFLLPGVGPTRSRVCRFLEAVSRCFAKDVYQVDDKTYITVI